MASLRITPSQRTTLCVPVGTTHTLVIRGDNVRKFKYWYLTKCIALCDYCLKFSDGADDQKDVNSVIAAKNYFIRQREAMK